MPSSPRVIVVGAGIIGASLAWHLAARGAAVTIVEAGVPGGVATPNSFAWINSNYSFSKTYFLLRHHSMADWRRLTRDVPGLPVSLNGSIYLPAERIDLEDFVRRNAEWGYRVELIDGARLRELEPNLALKAEVAAHALDEGAVEADEAARILAGAAVSRGAVLRENTQVQRLALSGGRVSGVVIDGETVNADEVVVAAGAATPALVRDTGFEVPLSTPPGLLAHTRPVSKLLNGLVLAEGLHLRQKANGQLLAGSDYQGSALADNPEEGGRELVRRMKAALRTEDDIVLESTTSGLRPMPDDGVPIVGRVPGVGGLYVTVTHSGVTLCPALGDMGAREILKGDRDALLAPFGPERFTSHSAATANA